MSEQARTGAAASGPVVLVLSPHAGHAERVVTVERALMDAEVRIGERILVSDLDAQQLAGRGWRERGFTAAIAAGGDGTIGAVVTHLAGSDLPLGILPLGTANDIARSLRLPLDLAAACRAIAQGVPAAIDAGQVLPGHSEPAAVAAAAGRSPPGGGRAGAYFLHALTLGLNVEFARLATDVVRRRRWGALTYATSALEALTRYHPLPVTVRFTGVWQPERRTVSTTPLTIACTAVQIAIINLPVFGGRLGLSLPDVAIEDRLLDFVIVEALEPQRLRASVEALLTALTQRSERAGLGGAPRQPGDTAHDEADVLAVALPGIHRFKACEAHIETTGQVPITLDGEIRSETPALVRVAPEPLRVLVPPEALQEIQAAHHAHAASTGRV